MAHRFALRPDPEDLHEYLSFEDPEEERTWVFDVTFLTSSYRCIYGQGCPGVLTEPAPELVHGCCTYAAHFTGDDDVERVRPFIDRLGPDRWQFHGVAARKGGPLIREKDGHWRLRSHQNACIMLNRVGFPTGPGCALHQAALEAGERPMDWKPDVCWQVPLRRVDSVDELGHVTSTVREWKRRDWGAGGAEFHWWCTDGPGAFVASEPVYVTMRDELIGMTSQAVYDLLLEALHRRGTERLLPHPVVRTRP